MITVAPETHTSHSAVAGFGECVDAEDVDHHLQHGEHAGLDDGDGVQQRTHRRRRHHGGRQPEVERHQCRLADAEHIERQQKAKETGTQLAFEDSARLEVERARNHAGCDDGRKQEHHRGAKQQPQIHAPRAHRLRRGLVRDQRIGRERQRLVEDEQREQVLRERDAHGGGNRDGEANVVRRLPRLVVAAHVADRVDRVDDPKRSRNEGEQHAQRLDLERQLEARHHLVYGYLRPRTGQDVRQQAPDEEGELGGRRQRDGLAQIGRAVKERQQERSHQRNDHCSNHEQFRGELRDHLSPPSSILAAAAATSALARVSMPK